MQQNFVIRVFLHVTSYFSVRKKNEKNGSHLACTHLRGCVTAPRPNAVIVARMVGNWLSVNTLV